MTWIVLDSSGNGVAYFIPAIPEPSTAILAGFGLLGLLSRRPWRKSQDAAA